MKRIIFKLVQLGIDWFLIKIRNSRPGKYAFRKIIDGAMSISTEIAHHGLVLKFAVPNDISQWRADSFSTKEPETLDWIDSMQSGTVLWDVGANVGIYSCYAANKKKCRVFAFEPSVFNLELLARNIFLNGLTNQVTIIPLPLSEKLAISELHMTSTSWGGAMSTFGQDYGHDGKPMEEIFTIPTIGLSMDESVRLLGIPHPDYIKMDVDGIEHLILEGGKSVLANAKSILIEINDKFTLQANQAESHLLAAGFTLETKTHADYFDTMTSAASHTYNQIWTKQRTVISEP